MPATPTTEEILVDAMEGWGDLLRDQDPILSGDKQAFCDALCQAIAAICPADPNGSLCARLVALKNEFGCTCGT